MTTIAVFASPQDADLARARLESAGIAVHLPDDAVTGFLGYVPPLVEGLRLQVSEEDATRAAEILGEPGTTTDPGATPA